MISFSSYFWQIRLHFLKLFFYAKGRIYPSSVANMGDPSPSCVPGQKKKKKRPRKHIFLSAFQKIWIYKSGLSSPYFRFTLYLPLAVLMESNTISREHFLCSSIKTTNILQYSCLFIQLSLPVLVFSRQWLPKYQGVNISVLIFSTHNSC